jgi:hypothetical protein
MTHEPSVDRETKELLGRLHQWCNEQRDRVQACYLPLPISGQCIKVFVVARGNRFDFALSDSIAALELELDDAGWPCDILQIATGAPEELQAFFDPTESIQVCGET